MEHCTIRENKQYGIFVGNHVTPDMPVESVGCLIDKNGNSGIRLMWESNASINLIDTTVSRNDGVGILYAAGNYTGYRECQVIAHNSVIRDNQAHAILLKYGGYVPVGGAILENCLISGNGESISFNKETVHLYWISAINCEITNNLSDALSFFKVHELGFSNNIIKGNNGNGIEFYPDDHNSGINTIELGADNEFFNNSQYDIYNRTSAVVFAENNYWGETTTAELQQGTENLTKIYDSRDDDNVGAVIIQNFLLQPPSDNPPTPTYTNIPTATFTPTGTIPPTPTPTPTEYTGQNAAPTPKWVFSFDSDSEFTEIPGGFDNNPPVVVTVGDIPSDGKGLSDGQGVRIDTAPGAVTLLLFPTLDVGENAVLIRASVQATGGAAAVALAALDGSMDGSIATNIPANSTIFQDDYKRICLVYEAPGNTIAPIIQVNNLLGQDSVSVYFDNLEIYLFPHTTSIPADMLYRDSIISTPSSPPLDNLLAYYPFDGNTYDYSGNENHGESHGGGATESGKFVDCYTFDGIDDYVEIPNVWRNQDALTIETWVRLDTHGINEEISPAGIFLGFGHDFMGGILLGHTQIFTKIPSITFMLESDQDIMLTGANSSSFFVNQSESTAWIHVAAVITNDYSKIYLNGELFSRTNSLFGQGMAWTRLEDDQSKSLIGIDFHQERPYFKGALDDLRIWAGERNRSEIQQSMERHLDLPKPEPPIIPSEPIGALQPAPPQAGAYYGVDVAIQDDVAVVGAYREDNMTGAVYVYRLLQDKWVLEQQLMSPDPQEGSGFGGSIAIDDNIIVVGAESQDDPEHRSGAAYFFLYDEASGAWSEGTKIPFSGKKSTSTFGSGICLDRERGRLVIGGAGGPSGAGFWTGGIWFFEWNEAHQMWEEVHNARQSDPEADDYFGQFNALSGDRILIGAQAGVSHSTGQGKAYMFEWDETKGQWTETHKFTPSDAADIHIVDYGHGVDLEGDVAVIGAPGASPDSLTQAGQVYVYEWIDGEWIEQQILVPNDPHEEDRFGNKVTLFSNMLFIGANMADGVVEDTGAVYRFERENGVWTQKEKFFVPHGQAIDWFGVRIDYDGEHLIVGAPRTDGDAGKNQGAAYIFSFKTEPPDTPPHGVPNPGDTITVNIPNLPSDAQTLELVRIPAGTFVMGSPADEQDRLDTDWPSHPVTITTDFYLGQYEITQAQYEAVMWNVPSSVYGLSLNYPVYEVTWQDAATFCNRLSQLEGRTPVYTESGDWPADLNASGYRLPTEAEWEYACRAGTQTRFYWGDDPYYTEITNYGRYLFYDGNRYLSLGNVGQKIPNAFYLYDMSGNVKEWCNDWWQDPHPRNAVRDPVGPNTGTDRVVRNGCWAEEASICRSAFRTKGFTNSLLKYMGFRIARNATSAPVIQPTPENTPTLTPTRIPTPIVTPTPTEKDQPPSTFTLTIANLPDTAKQLEMVLIEAGTFTMGSPDDEKGRDDAKDWTTHKVT
ncbi:SUMF1/EgtB/PvdO family nonheme iron enzyme, partial [bacterium]|nr:SUMF1/EgtB/PvdO family nonheme iron enzyme [bacterium]